MRMPHFSKAVVITVAAGGLAIAPAAAPFSSTTATPNGVRMGLSSKSVPSAKPRIGFCAPLNWALK